MTSKENYCTDCERQIANGQTVCGYCGGLARLPSAPSPAHDLTLDVNELPSVVEAQGRPHPFSERLNYFRCNTCGLTKDAPCHAPSPAGETAERKYRIQAGPDDAIDKVVDEADLRTEIHRTFCSCDNPETCSNEYLADFDDAFPGQWQEHGGHWDLEDGWVRDLEDGWVKFTPLPEPVSTEGRAIEWKETSVSGVFSGGTCPHSPSGKHLVARTVCQYCEEEFPRPSAPEAAAASEFTEVELDAGHLYKLPSLDGEYRQELRFVKRMGKGFPGNAAAYAGTTSQAVLRCLIRRTRYVNGQVPDLRNLEAIGCLRRVIFLFEQRAAERHGKFFAGTESDIESQPMLAASGHCEQLWVATSIAPAAATGLMRKFMTATMAQARAEDQNNILWGRIREQEELIKRLSTHDHTWTQREADFFAERNAAWAKLTAAEELIQEMSGTGTELLARLSSNSFKTYAEVEERFRAALARAEEYRKGAKQ